MKKLRITIDGSMTMETMIDDAVQPFPHTHVEGRDTIELVLDEKGDINTVKTMFHSIEELRGTRNRLHQLAAFIHDLGRYVETLPQTSIPRQRIAALQSEHSL